MFRARAIARSSGVCAGQDSYYSGVEPEFLQVKSLEPLPRELGQQANVEVQTDVIDVTLPNWLPYFQHCEVDVGTQTAPTTTQVGQTPASATSFLTDSWEPLETQLCAVGLRVRLCHETHSLPVGERGLVKGGFGLHCQVRFDNYTSGAVVWPIHVFEAWVPHDRTATTSRDTSMKYAAEKVSSATQVGGDQSRASTSVQASICRRTTGSQTVRGLEQGGCTSYPARRITAMDEVVNQYHRGALYLERYLQAVESSVSGDTIEVVELREFFTDWDRRMSQFKFVKQGDASTQASAC